MFRYSFFVKREGVVERLLWCRQVCGAVFRLSLAHGGVGIQDREMSWANVSFFDGWRDGWMDGWVGILRDYLGCWLDSLNVGWALACLLCVVHRTGYP